MLGTSCPPYLSPGTQVHRLCLPGAWRRPLTAESSSRLLEGRTQKALASGLPLTPPLGSEGRPFPLPCLRLQAHFVLGCSFVTPGCGLLPGPMPGSQRGSERVREESPALGPLEAYGLFFVECTLLCSEKITPLLPLGPQRESSAVCPQLSGGPSLQPGDWRLASPRRGPWKGSLQVGPRLLREERAACAFLGMASGALVCQTTGRTPLLPWCTTECI